ncbi:MAG: transporter substrate-binding domain-containing protein [Eubacterium sp.]|nr:transporter substrate-binding domain-containing protein [Eubacterium sp.]
MLRFKRLKKMVFFSIIVSLILSVLFPLASFAKEDVEEEKKVVRVGWHEPPYFITDENGRKSGYSYEYQRKVAAYTGWEYEYVEGTWHDLMEKLKKGEIDLMSDVSYKEERAKDILYTSIPMGTEVYYIYVSPENKEISADNLSSLNGKKIGVTTGSIQKDFLVDWMKVHQIEADVIEYNCTGDEGLAMLDSEIDAFATMDVYGTPETAVPVSKIGSSDFYFAVNKNRPDLLSELDAALNSIQDENKYYDQLLHDKYLKSSETNKFLSNSEIIWLSNHGKIRIGYQDDYLAFCAADPETGELTGALKDYLDLAAASFENARIDFEAVSYPTSGAAIEALRKGEVDCVFPANLTAFDAENLGLVMSPTIIRSEMDAVVRESDQKKFSHKNDIIAAVNEGNTNYDLFLDENFPAWQKSFFPNTSAGLNAVAEGKVDCVVISGYRYSNISKQCEKLHLTTVYTGVDMDYSIALRAGDTELYSIVAKFTGNIPSATIHTALTYYSTEDVKTSFGDIIKRYLFVILVSISIILFVILILLFGSISAQKKLREEEKMLKVLNKRVFVDALTSVRNKGAYNEYIQKIQEKLENGEDLNFAIAMFDCNDLKSINDKYGHDKGDIYLKKACQLICKVFEHSPVFRIGGDEFVVVLLNEDFEKREELVKCFETRRLEMCQAAKHKWEEVHMAFGLADYDSVLDKSANETAHRADKKMYDNKRLIKSKNE